MNLKKLILAGIALFLFTQCIYSQEILQWRGEERNGVFKEKNLLKSWPETGPALLWESGDIGNGYGSPVITSNNIYVNGEVGTDSYLFALDLTGKVLWKSKIGKEWVTTYPGARTTPTVVGNLIYATAGYGALACFDAKTGEQKWSVDMLKDYHGKNTRFGLSESVLVEDNKVYCMPGGADTNVVALDRFTGKVIWTCKGLGQQPSFCSPLLIKLPKRNILVTFSMSALLGIDTKDGKLLWFHVQDVEGDVHVNTPWYEDGHIYYITGNGNGAVKLKLSDDGTSVTQIWRNQDGTNCMGGFIKLNDYLYTPGYNSKYYYTIDAKTGKNIDSLNFNRSGTINYADGLIYLYSEKGQMGLFKPNGPKLEQVSLYKIVKGTGAHYAHPVINNGILYVRHGKSLLAYDIKKK